MFVVLLLAGSKTVVFFNYPILDTIISVLLLPSCVTLRGPPLDSETGRTGEFWSKTNLIKWQN